MYQNIEESLHKAAQFIALCGINFSESKADDSHTTARWEPKKWVLEGGPLMVKDQRYKANVALSDFELQFKSDSDNVEHRIALQGQKVGDVIAALQQWSGVQADAWKGLHYDLPHSYFTNETVLSINDKKALRKWIDYRNYANEGLERLNDILKKQSPILIWPHHFDTGTHYAYAMENGTETRGTETRGMGAGLAIADSMVAEPYFYLYAHRADKGVDYQKAPQLRAGRWIVEEPWQGAVLPVSSLEGKKAMPVVERFCREAGLFLDGQLQ